MNTTRPGSGGKQARRHRRGTWIGAIIVFLCGLVMAAVAVGILVANPDDLEGGARVGMVAVFGVVGLGLVALAWYLYRKVRPAVPRHLRLEVSAEEARRAEPLQARLAIDRQPSAGVRLELALVCTERYDIEQRVTNPNGSDYNQRVTKTEELHRQAVPVTDGSDGATTSFTVPADGPFSYEGDCISAVWHVEAKERRPNRPDRALTRPLWVLP